MTHRFSGLLAGRRAENFNGMNNLSHRLCVAPMMDRNDSFSISIACDAACAARVHALPWRHYAHARGIAESTDDRLERTLARQSSFV